MARYTYRFHDLRTNAAFAELPLTSVSYSGALNGIGTFDATLALADERVRDLDPIGSTEPARTALYIDRDGVLVWGGIVWARDYSSSSRTLSLSGAELMSYFAGRYNRTDFDWTGLGAIDRIAVVRDWVVHAQDPVAQGTGVDIGIDTDNTDTTSGGSTVTDVAYLAINADRFDKVITDLSGVDNGIDWSIELGYDPSTRLPVKTWRGWYPRKGRPWFESAHVWEFGPSTRGNVTAYTWPEDGHRMANVILGFGAGEGELMVRYSQTDFAPIDAGYPRLQRVFVDKQEKSQAILAAKVRAQLAASSLPVVLPKLTVLADADPVFGGWTLGDDARVRITDEDRFPRQSDGSTGLDVFRRIVGYRVKVNDNGGPELVELTMGETLA